MRDFLRTLISIPQEREYEGWIMRGIDDYMLTVGRKAYFFAVSPAFENKWPADELLAINGKVIGLQMKRPGLSNPPGSASLKRHLHWDFSSPQGQFDLVADRKEIFYCLPTFTNVRYRRAALEHCLFWRPPKGSTNRRAYYDNDSNRLKVAHPKIAHATRWGYFIEKFLTCSIGRRMQGSALSSYLQDLTATIASASPQSVIQVLFVEAQTDPARS